MHSDGVGARFVSLVICFIIEANRFGQDDERRAGIGAATTAGRWHPKSQGLRPVGGDPRIPVLTNDNAQTALERTRVIIVQTNVAPVRLKMRRPKIGLQQLANLRRAKIGLHGQREAFFFLIKIRRRLAGDERALIVPVPSGLWALRSSPDGFLFELAAWAMNA